MAITMIDAVWGSQAASLDVTRMVAGLVALNPSAPIIAADSAILGDPSPGIHKHLTVRYFPGAGAHFHAAACEEGQSVTLNQVATASSALVVGAVYGAEQGSEDVTATVQDLVDRGIAKITADDTTFGDPAVGHLKNFGMSYSILTLPGVVKTLACQEGQTVEIT